MPQEPGPFGWVGQLLRWSTADRTTIGQNGPLPPPRARTVDPAGGEVYQGLADGWLHGTVGAALSSFFSEPRTRKELYVLFEKMDMTDYAGSVLDLYAEDATQSDPDTGRVVWFESQNDTIIAALEEMWARLRGEEECTALTRDVAKFGDDFERLIYRSGLDGGIFRMIPTPPIAVTRKEDKESKLLGYGQTGKKFRNENSDTSYPWDFVHFRLRGRDRRYPYGTSILHNGMRPWKQIIILEDWVLGYTVNKHPDRNALILDTGSASEVEAHDIARKVQQRLKKHILIDPAGTSGKNMGYRYDAMTPMEDLVIATRSGSNTRIEKLSGSANATDITPLTLCINRFFSACRAPQGFFGFDPSSGSPLNMKAALTNQDVRYARGVRRLQRSVKDGIRYLCELHLKLLQAPGDRVEDDAKQVAKNDGLRAALDFLQEGNDFTVQMGPISFLEELERLEVEQTRLQVAIAMSELGNNPAYKVAEWSAYIMREIIKAPEPAIEMCLYTQEEMEEMQAQQQEAEMMQAGIDPKTGKPMPKPAVAEQIIRRHLRSEGRPDGVISNDEKRKIAEAISRRPGLREVVRLGAKLWRGGSDEPLAESASLLLPDRNNELFKRGLLTDAVTESDLEEMVAEARGIPVDGDA
jgi:hypothetical protein